MGTETYGTSIPTARPAPPAPTTFPVGAVTTQGLAPAAVTTSERPDMGVRWAAATGEHILDSPRPGMEPRLRQLMGVCGWAAILGGLGLIVGIRGVFGLATGTPPAWYEPTVLLVGLTGLGLTVAAFLTVHRRGLPWALLTGASGFLAAAMAFTANAF